MYDPADPYKTDTDWLDDAPAAPGLTLENVRELLKAATPGPWSVYRETEWDELTHTTIDWGLRLLPMDEAEVMEMEDDDVRLMAAAPCLARAYIEQHERAEREAAGRRDELAITGDWMARAKSAELDRDGLSIVADNTRVELDAAGVPVVGDTLCGTGVLEAFMRIRILVAERDELRLALADALEAADG